MGWYFSISGNLMVRSCMGLEEDENGAFVFPYFGRKITVLFDNNSGVNYRAFSIFSILIF